MTSKELSGKMIIYGKKLGIQEIHGLDRAIEAEDRVSDFECGLLNKFPELQVEDENPKKFEEKMQPIYVEIMEMETEKDAEKTVTEMKEA